MLSSVESPAMTRKAYSYIRFSGKRQEAGDSYRRQMELAEAAAKEEGIPLDHTLTSSLADKGVPAFRGQNAKGGKLRKFLNLVDDGTVPRGSVLIIEQVNRLSRMPWLEQADLWREILQRGIIIRTCVPPGRYTEANMNDLSTGCPLAIYMMIAHQESRQKSQWLKSVWGEKKKQAQADNVPHGRNVPGWLNAVTTPHPRDPARIVTTGYRLNKERAEVVRFIFERTIAGDGAMRVGRLLRERGVPPFDSRHNKRGQVANWTPSSIRGIVSSRTTLGEYQPQARGESGKSIPDGRPIANYYPAVIDEETWARAQAARRRRRGKGGNPSDKEANLFTHLAIEAESGMSLHCQLQTRGLERYRYLSNQHRTQVVPYPKFETAVLDAIDQLSAQDVDGRHEADALTARVESLQKERTELGLDLDDLTRQLSELPRERRSPRIAARMGELEEMIQQKDEQLRIAKEAANTSGRTDALTEFKTYRQLLREVKGTPRETTIRKRIRSRLQLLIESLWVKVQTKDNRNRYVHVYLYLQGSEKPRYFKIQLGACAGFLPDALEDRDFRAEFFSRRNT